MRSFGCFQAMAQQLVQHMYKSVFVNVEMFKNLDENAITKLCGLLKPYTAMAGDTIFKPGEVGREVYIILEGRVQVARPGVVTTEENGQKTLGPGATFGEGCCADLFDIVDDDDKPVMYTREISAKAIDDCELRFLTLDNLKEVCALYPSVRSQLWLLVRGFAKERQDAEVAYWNANSDTEVTGSVVDIAKEFTTKLRVRRRSIGEYAGDPRSPQIRSGSLTPLRTGSVSGSSGSMRNLGATSSVDLAGEQVQQLDVNIAKLEGRVNQLEAKLEGRVSKLEAVIEKRFDALDDRFDAMMRAVTRLEQQSSELHPQASLPNLVVP